MKICIPVMQVRKSLRLRFSPQAIHRPSAVYHQGDLDGLCGLYSLVNVSNHLRGPFSHEESTELLRELTDTYSKEWSVLEALLDGINGYQMTYLLKQVVIPRYQLFCSKPFHKYPKAPTELVWAHIAEWTASGGLVILGTEEHWTVIEKTTHKTVLLRDM